MKKYLLQVVALAFFLITAAGCGNSATESPEETGTSPASEVVEELFLNLTEPVDEDVVYAPALRVSGSTLTDAVVSINGVMTEVGYDGVFTEEITLDIGPNVIEVIASDFFGNEKSDILTVIYIPEN